jgi:hypothetical protein
VIKLLIEEITISKPEFERWIKTLENNNVTCEQIREIVKRMKEMV